MVTVGKVMKTWIGFLQDGTVKPRDKFGSDCSTYHGVITVLGSSKRCRRQPKLGVETVGHFLKSIA